MCCSLEVAEWGAQIEVNLKQDRGQPTKHRIEVNQTQDRGQLSKHRIEVNQTQDRGQPDTA
jgi:hypothetical protein